jgi:hypothetical protein
MEFRQEKIILGDKDAVKSAINSGFGVSIKHPINIIVRKDKRLSNLANSFLQFVRAQRASALD